MSKDRLSIFISLILRHKPDEIGITLDEHGWANVKELIDGINNTGRKIDMEILEEIVRLDNKGRYSFNEDKTLIRANQGHSVHVDVELKEVDPPSILYHGTATRFLDSIKQQGIKSMSRLYVHLSNELDTAIKVGNRHGDCVILIIDTAKMHEDGIKFYLSENGVWLTKYIDWKYVKEVKYISK
jgi:putative RNA 2'-phosphotransferase